MTAQMPMHYYNENDPHAAKWLRNLIAAELIPAGEVDERSICDVKSGDLEGFTQVHLFAGIGGWAHALSLAGWPVTRRIWTGSCPCQPFSVAGKGHAQKDARHLWPEMFRLMRECRPDITLGEQVENAIGHGWLDGVSADLEGEGHAVGSAVLGAHSVCAPHKRQRLFWVSVSGAAKCGWGPEPTGQHRGTLHLADRSGAIALPESRPQPTRRISGQGVVIGTGSTVFAGQYGEAPVESSGRNSVGSLPNPGRSPGHAEHGDAPGEREGGGAVDGSGVGPGGEAGGIRHADQQRCRETRSSIAGERLGINGPDGGLPNGESRGQRIDRGPSGCAGYVDQHGEVEQLPDKTGIDSVVCDSFWRDSYALLYGDKKYRRVPFEPAFFPLAPRFPGRVGRLRGYGNAIVPQVAAEFVKAVMHALADRGCV